MNINDKIDKGLLREFFDYREDGNLIWKEIPLIYFKKEGSRSAEYLCNWHNKKYSNKLALVHFDSKGYQFGYINKKPWRLHRAIWMWHNGEFKSTQIDHVNGNRSDNKIENLREVNNQENHRNMKLKTNNTSGQTGVYYAKLVNKWVAQIKLSGKQIRLGSFDTFEEAIKIRKEAEFKNNFHINHGRY